jgi:small subunit ribosomal protein S8
MSANDPIADMMTRIRNAGLVGHALVAMPSSKTKVAIAKVLQDEGFIESYEVVDGKTPAHKMLRMRLKYTGERRDRRPVISGLERVSRPGRRIRR